MSRSHSAWLARRIRKSRQRRSRSVAAALALALVLLVLPVFVRLPVQIEESILDKIVPVGLSSSISAVKCPTAQGDDGAMTLSSLAKLKVRKGSGTYKLDNPQGVLRNVQQTSSNHTKESTDDTTLISWSQYGQDLWIDTYLGQKRSGTFVEVGGFDGEAHSNTLFLEKQRGWQGILIEANPYSFELMQSKDRACWMAHACIASQNHSQLTFQLAGGITSALEVVSAQHSQRMKQALPEYRNQRNWKGAGETWCIPCFDFVAIMQQTDIFDKDKKRPREIDYFSLDVEGAELEILQAILDNKRQNMPDIRLFSIEMQENTHKIRHFLWSKNYREIATIGIDSVFALRPKVELSGG